MVQITVWKYLRNIYRCEIGSKEDSLSEQESEEDPHLPRKRISQKQVSFILDNHLGFSKSFQALHLQTRTWVRFQHCFLEQVR